MSQDGWLALHTTDTPGAIALASNGEVRARPLDAAGKHASTLLGAIDALLTEMHTDIAALQGIVLTCGPGSFTGIRIGIATAQGLSQAIGATVCGCDSLWAEAAAQSEPGWVAVVLDARRGEVYAGLYRVGDGAPEEVVAPFVDAPDAAARRLLGGVDPETPLRLTGSGAALLQLDGDSAQRVQQIESVPRPDVARALTAAAKAGLLVRLAPRDIKPLYLRKSDAELNREARLGTR